MLGNVWKGVIGAVALALACGPEGGSNVAASAEKGAPSVFEFARLVGVPRPYTGATNAIRGVPGGGLPWVISQGEASLAGDGTLRVEVEGLVIDPNDPAAQARGVAGQNPIPQLKAIVSCQTVQQTATGPVAAVSNVATAPVDATTGAAADGGGNATIEEVLALPSPCIAPIVFVASAAGAWFAASGF